MSVIQHAERNIAECGKTGCACTRTLYPSVRTRFREEVVRRAAAARAAGALPVTGRLSYVSFGAGHLLADLDLVCGLEEQGFTVEAAALIDTASISGVQPLPSTAFGLAPWSSSRRTANTAPQPAA